MHRTLGSKSAIKTRVMMLLWLAVSASVAFGASLAIAAPGPDHLADTAWRLSPSASEIEGDSANAEADIARADTGLVRLAKAGTTTRKRHKRTSGTTTAGNGNSNSGTSSTKPATTAPVQPYVHGVIRQ
jgi:hypothetical protein